MSITTQNKSAVTSESPVVEMYCANCWRDEYHRPRQRSEALVGFFTFLTLGLYYLLRTFRCVTCGNVRVRAGRASKD